MPSTNEFSHDVFLSCSSADRPRVLRLAERLLALDHKELFDVSLADAPSPPSETADPLCRLTPVQPAGPQLAGGRFQRQDLFVPIMVCYRS
jgi:hypothetical protein